MSGDMLPVPGARRSIGNQQLRSASRVRKVVTGTAYCIQECHFSRTLSAGASASMSATPLAPSCLFTPAWPPSGLPAASLPAPAVPSAATFLSAASAPPSPAGALSAAASSAAALSDADLPAFSAARFASRSWRSVSFACLMVQV